MIHASLFSGIGGPEVAAAMLGWDNAFHCEINPFGKAVLEYWFPNSKSYDDITKASFKEWRGRIDVLTGGFPCQPFSYAGKRGGRNDDRYLWPEMLRVIDEVRPAWVVGENVAGITTMVEGGILSDMGCDPVMFGEGDGLHRYQLRERFTIERICCDLEGLGYSVQPLLIPAAAVGAPHRRDRVFIVAHDADADGCNDERKAGGYEGEGRAERLQERDEVREPGIANHVRSEVPGPSADTDREGLGTTRKPGGDGAKERDDKGRPISLSAYYAGTEGTWWDKFPTVSPVHRGNDGIPFDVDCLTVPPMPGPPNYGKGDPQRYPFGKWRTESLKAYGNAIVPQVMYRIFQAIEAAK